MPDTQAHSGWNILPPVTVPAEDRPDHVRTCSDFAAGLLDRFPGWGEDLDAPWACDPARLAGTASSAGCGDFATARW
jgi:hypothetical protein